MCLERRYSNSFPVMSHYLCASVLVSREMSVNSNIPNIAVATNRDVTAIWQTALDDFETTTGTKIDRMLPVTDVDGLLQAVKAQ